MNTKNWILRRACLASLGALMIFLVSCSSPLQFDPKARVQGYVVINLEENFRSIVPALTLDPAQYEFLFKKTGEADRQVVYIPGQNLAPLPLPLGTWTLDVSAQNASGVLIGRGNTSILIEADKTSVAQVQVLPVVGSGTVEFLAPLQPEMKSTGGSAPVPITVVDPRFEVTLTPVSGGSPLEISLLNDEAQAFVSLAGVGNGWYLAQARYFSGDQRLASGMETLLVVADAISPVKIQAYQTINGYVLSLTQGQPYEPQPEEFDGIRVYAKGYGQIHFWDVVASPGITATAWPGVALEDYEGEWKCYEFPKALSLKLIFNQPSQTTDLQRSEKGDWTYENGAWREGKPDGVLIPTVSASLSSGLYLTPQTVILTSTNSDDEIYYSLTDTSGFGPPTGYSPNTLYTEPISVPASRDLVAYAINKKGERGADSAWSYTINPDADLEAPTMASSKSSGRYDAPFSATFSVKDNKTASVKVYFTTDGSTPSLASPLYAEGTALTPLSGPPQSVGASKTFRFLAQDSSGNKAFFTWVYTFGAGSLREDFREETVYFLMTTRFYDGDTSNNRASSWDYINAPYGDLSWRGDFKGLIEKLPYIKALGFSAVWITPPVLNRNYFDFHGYHGWDFTQTDKRLESPGATYQDLINAIHAYDMKIIQDIVLNHSGRYGLKDVAEVKYWGDRDDPDWGKDNFDYYDAYNPQFEYDGVSVEPLSGKHDYNGDLWQKEKPVFTWEAATEYYWWNGQSFTHAQDLDNLWGQPSPYSSPEGYRVWHFQWPGMYESQFTLLDPIWFHRFWLKNWEDYTVQLGTIHEDCLDLNTENAVVQDYLIDAYSRYIQMGVDGFRIDTVKHISRNTFNRRFNHAFHSAAAAAGNPNFYMVGEVCVRDHGVWNKGLAPVSQPFYTWKEPVGAPYLNTADDLQAAHEAFDYAMAQGTGAQPTSQNHLLGGPQGNDYTAPDTSRFSGLHVIDFRMHWNFGSAKSAWNVRDGDIYTNDATWNLTYVESHDYSPFEIGNSHYARTSDQDLMAENWSLMFTWRGIPAIFYGNEILFKGGAVIDVGPTKALEETGRAYFGGHITGSVVAAGFGEYSNATGNIATTLNHPLAKHLRKLNLIRRAVPALQKGQYSTQGVQGEMAFKRRFVEENKGIDSFVLVAITDAATFSGIPNGRYVDVVTGDVKNVSTGTLAVALTGKGNVRAYVLDNGKGMTGFQSLEKIGEDGFWIK